MSYPRHTETVLAETADGNSLYVEATFRLVQGGGDLPYCVLESATSVYDMLTLPDEEAVNQGEDVLDRLTPRERARLEFWAESQAFPAPSVATVLFGDAGKMEDK